MTLVFLETFYIGGPSWFPIVEIFLYISLFSMVLSYMLHHSTAANSSFQLPWTNSKAFQVISVKTFLAESNAINKCQPDNYGNQNKFP